MSMDFLGRNSSLGRISDFLSFRLPFVCRSLILNLKLKIQNCSFLCSERGQNTVEYLMMLSIIVTMILTMSVMFHKKLLGAFFSVIGMIIGTTDKPQLPGA